MNAIMSVARLVASWKQINPECTEEGPALHRLTPAQRAGYLLYMNGGQIGPAFEAAAMMAISESLETRKAWRETAYMILEAESDGLTI